MAQNKKNFEAKEDDYKISKVSDIIDILVYYLPQDLNLPVATLSTENILSLKSDFDLMIKRAFGECSGADGTDFQSLTTYYNLTNRILHSIIAGVISENNSTDDNVKLSKRTSSIALGTYLPPIDDIIPKKRQRKSIQSSTSTVEYPYGQSYCITQKSQEGTYFFSSALKKHHNDALFDSNANKVKIDPTSSLSQNLVPNISSVAANRRIVYGKKLLTRVKTVSAEFPEYGPFFSFAPAIDSGRATLSRAESIMVKLPGRTVYIDSSPEEPTNIEKNSDFPVFNGKHNPDFPELISLPTQEELNNLTNKKIQCDPDISLPDIDIKSFIQNPIKTKNLIHQNTELLKKLQEYQHQRYKARNHGLQSIELDTALALQKNLLEMVSLCSPESFISEKQLALAMECVQKTENAYKGALPPNLPFSYACNTTGNGVIPQGAGSRPLRFS